jgi:uncharacterized protein (DUF2141 family)
MFIKKLISVSVLSSVISVIGSLSMILLLSHSVHAADLTIKINEIEEGKGHLFIALYEGVEAYDSGKAVHSSKVKANNTQESVTFTDLADGEYAIKLYQDENDNNKLDTNLLGIPNEGYGFSNNVGMFGAPKYQKAKFTVKDNTVIEIGLF